MQLVEFLQTSFQNVRSSKRTDDLHDVLLSEILEKNPQWRDLDWRFEYKLRQDGFGGTFDIDIAGFEGADMFNTGSLKVAILAKSKSLNHSKFFSNISEATKNFNYDIVFSSVSCSGKLCSSSLIFGLNTRGIK